MRDKMYISYEHEYSEYMELFFYLLNHSIFLYHLHKKQFSSVIKEYIQKVTNQAGCKHL